MQKQELGKLFYLLQTWHQQDPTRKKNNNKHINIKCCCIEISTDFGLSDSLWQNLTTLKNMRKKIQSTFEWYWVRTCQPQHTKNLETNRNLCCIVRMSFLTMSEYSLKITQAFRVLRMSITACENRDNFLPWIVEFDWLISDQLRYSLNIYQFDWSVLHFPIENSSNKSTKSTSCLFSFLTSRK